MCIRRVKKWKVYCEVLKNKCIRQPEQNNECHETVIAFSSGNDRGGYVHCNQETFDFFLKLFELVMSLEEEDGSLSQAFVDKNVSQGKVL